MFEITFYSSALNVYLEIEKFYSCVKFTTSERISLSVKDYFEVLLGCLGFLSVFVSITR